MMEVKAPTIADIEAALAANDPVARDIACQISGEFARNEVSRVEGVSAIFMMLATLSAAIIEDYGDEERAKIHDTLDKQIDRAKVFVAERMKSRET
jgi:hypothetical protein